MQAALDGPPIFQGRLEPPLAIQTPPPSQARMYAHINIDVLVSTLNVVAGHLPLVCLEAFVLLDSGATHSLFFVVGVG